MNWHQIEGRWHQIKGRAKEHWAALNADEPGQLEAKREQLLGSLQHRFGISREDAERQIRDWQPVLDWQADW